MSSTEEMRRVILHARDQAIASRKAEEGRPQISPPRTSTLVTLAYIEAVLDLLSAYLVVEDVPA